MKNFSTTKSFVYHKINADLVTYQEPKTELKYLVEQFFLIPGLSDIVFNFLNFEKERLQHEQKYIKEGEKLIVQKFSEVITQRSQLLDESNMYLNNIKRNIQSNVGTTNTRENARKFSQNRALQCQRGAEKIGGNLTLLRHIEVLLSSINGSNPILIHELNCIEAALLKRTGYNYKCDLIDITNRDFVVARSGGIDYIANGEYYYAGKGVKFYFDHERSIDPNNHNNKIQCCKDKCYIL